MKDQVILLIEKEHICEGEIEIMRAIYKNQISSKASNILKLVEETREENKLPKGEETSDSQKKFNIGKKCEEYDELK